MKRWTKALLAVAVGCVALGGLAYAWRGDIALAVMKRNIATALATDAIAELPDGLHVGLCGAGSPFPDALRSGRASPSWPVAGCSSSMPATARHGTCSAWRLRPAASKHCC